jgi:hypothetical protein
VAERGGDRPEVAAEVAGVRDGDALGGLLRVGLEDDGRLVGPPAVDRLLADAGAARDLVDRRRDVALLVE